MANVTRFSPVTKDRVGRPKTTEYGFCRAEIDGTPYLLREVGRKHKADPKAALTIGRRKP